VQYLPARGRYKVYLIDEVHMLSTHSFNALLKTLEEPPPHVKFLLATTDPQKLPVTVLSRCLQFNLKRLSPALIIKRLAEIFAAEKIEHEPEALRLLAKAAQGSMRDALSLLDQVIAFGGNRVSAADTRTMLGTIEQGHVIELLAAVAARDAKQVFARVAELDERVPDYHGVLADIASTLQRVALVQSVPDFSLDDGEDVEAIQHLAKTLSPEEVQLNYQIALVGRRDLDLAPDTRGGFEMVLLRMLAFQPAREGGAELAAPAAAIARTHTQSAVRATSPVAAKTNAVGDDWARIVAQLGLQGPVSQLAAHCSLLGKEGPRVRLLLDATGEPFRRPALEDKLTQALAAYFGETIKLDIELGVDANAITLDTPARRQQAQDQDRLQAARVSIESDPNIKAMRDIFGATVQPESIKPN
jgi:DNA polymerase-3 subunit gamma/tau